MNDVASIAKAAPSGHSLRHVKTRVCLTERAIEVFGTLWRSRLGNTSEGATLSGVSPRRTLRTTSSNTISAGGRDLAASFSAAASETRSEAHARMSQLVTFANRFRDALALLPLLPVLIYQASYMNGFAPITEGWFSAYAALIRGGAVPYRDFNFLLPPLYPYVLAGLQALFGNSLLPLHWFGLFVTACIGVVLYLLLRACFPPGVAGVAAAVGLVYYQSGNAFFGYDFTQIVTLWLLLAVLMLDRLLQQTIEGELPRRPTRLRMVFAGAFLALAILTKHSNAGVCSLILIGAVAVVVFRARGLRDGIWHLWRLTLGISLPLAIAIACLARAGAAGDFFQQIFGDAAAAKGGVRVALTHWGPRFFNDDYTAMSCRAMAGGIRGLATTLLLVGGMAAAFRCFGYRTSGISELFLLRPVDDARRVMYSLLLAMCAAVSLGAVLYSVRYDEPSQYAISLWRGRRIYEQAMPVAVNLYLVGSLVSCGVFLWRPTALYGRAFLLFTFGVGLTCGNGTSAGIGEISAFVGVSLITAFLLRAGLPYLLPTIIPMMTVLAFATFLFNMKYEKPYHWWSITTPDIRHTETRQAAGLLAGLGIPAEKYDAIQKITEAITRHSDSNEAVYIYPHMPIFYLLSDRPPFHNAVVSWFDFMSDRQAIRVAQALRNAPPAVIVVADVPEDVLVAHEQLFRGGRPLAQRKIIEVIDDLLANGRLCPVERVPQIDGLPVTVYARCRPEGR